MINEDKVSFSAHDGSMLGYASSGRYAGSTTDRIEAEVPRKERMCNTEGIFSHRRTSRVCQSPDSR